MCIRDRQNPLPRGNTVNAITMLDDARGVAVCDDGIMLWSCLLYTSDAADERSSVDLGGRRIINKKTRYVQ